MSCLSSPLGDPTRSMTSRPKLTLQTTSLPRTFGSSSTGLSLSLAAGSTASPTVRNTFKNAYDVTSPTSTSNSPSTTAPPSLRLNCAKPTSPYIHHAHNHTTSFFHRSNPYQLPLGVRSILRNSPLEPTARRRSGSISAGASGPGGAGARRVFFPAKKQVSYRNPLEEEIRTVRYTAQHFDLFEKGPLPGAVHDQAASQSADSTSESPEEEDSDAASAQSGSETGSASSDDVGANRQIAAKPSTALSRMERKKRRTLRAERQVRAVALLDGLDSIRSDASTPQTPRQGRAKRRREWRWTLGPLESSSNEGHVEIPAATSTTQPTNFPSETLSHG
ncbi:Uncharacterized protein PECH_004686 [Penicillium ucsense]|uniref:Uncharacterized protein n=1 Tax=Penicillium ucsense TaxID=2839758 RepID=A0A8J8W6R7_9EURO|nr:Uncharacterized protein PECM_003442 [Penicillium ucsense]KAF7736880.1 Uncharacterized protein PECH_004686 [Penicillium ucsense]